MSLTHIQIMIGLTTDYLLYVSGMGSSTEFSASSTSTSTSMNMRSWLSITVDLTGYYSHYIWVLVFLLSASASIQPSHIWQISFRNLLKFLVSVCSFKKQCTNIVQPFLLSSLFVHALCHDQPIIQSLLVCELYQPVASSMHPYVHHFDSGRNHFLKILLYQCLCKL